MQANSRGVDLFIYVPSRTASFCGPGPPLRNDGYVDVALHQLRGYNHRRRWLVIGQPVMRGRPANSGNYKLKSEHIEVGLEAPNWLRKLTILLRPSLSYLLTDLPSTSTSSKYISRTTSG